MKNPRSTYRIQFHSGFTFLDFERIIPYLDKLGIGTVYASPIFEAVPGSVHGYDSVNPLRINPEIGTETQLQAISQQLKERGMNWIQDIVPNHMAFHPNNTWLMDVLEKGQHSPYAPFFDIDWASPVHNGRLMVPFLGASLDDVIDQNELTIAWQDNKLVICYFDTAYPLHARSYATLLRATNPIPAAVQDLCDQVDQLLTITEPDAYARHAAEFQAQLIRLLGDPKVKKQVDGCLKAINASPKRIRQIADEQVYHLCFSGEADHQINYRRFFTVNSLICLNVQDSAVFDHVHGFIKSLLQAGIFQGLRVDHIDGLYDPSRYLEQLRELAGNDAYIVVEKILKTDEDFPRTWPVQGATGYRFLSIVNNLFTQTSSEALFTKFYQTLRGEQQTVRQELHDKKTDILYKHMAGELENLHRLFLTLQIIEENVLANMPPHILKLAIGEFLIQCPVYRYYGNSMPLDNQESTAVQAIFTQIRAIKPELSPAVDLLNEALLVKPQTADDAYNQRALHFYQRCMQFTGPLMAKGVEDTLMYTYTRFIGHDEVGDSPEFFGLSVADFHQKMIDRQAHWPLSLNATSTHDTKRGEDVRSRLNVLTDLTDEWIALVQEWQQLNRNHKQGESSPDSNDEYFMYQTLVGAYPMPSAELSGVDTSRQEEDDFPDRLMEYLQKAFREAKRYTTHDKPNEAYEEATRAFATQLLDKRRSFWKRFQPFHQRVADFGIINSLAQIVLKCTCPGLPDVYQGSELWDLSLVDPDNRRTVDFDQRRQCLDELMACQSETQWSALWPNRYDGRIKLWLLHTLLSERNQQPDLFRNGQYTPLRVEGTYQQHVLAFARHDQQTWYVIAVPLGLASLSRDQHSDGFTIDWKDTCIPLPNEVPEQWENRLLTSFGKTQPRLPLADLFKDLPLAILKLKK